LPYAGRAAFEAHCQSMMARLPAKDRKNYIIAPNRRRAWEVAVSSAEHAQMLSHEQRVDEFIPPISQSLVSNAESQFSSPSVGCSSQTTSCSSGVVPDIQQGDPLSTVPLRRTGRDSEPTLRQTAAREQFVAFCRHNHKSLCLMHPGFTAEQIDRLLLMQWNELDSAARSRYSGENL